MKKVELLAPVGNYEAFLAAVQNGADAVYLGGMQFGARAFASNFDEEKLVEVFHYAHIRNVRVHVTVNTVIFDEELESAKKFIDFLNNNGCDGVIVQDIGLMDWIRRTYPSLPVHVSTQVNVHNCHQLKFFEAMGVKRIVLARETSLDDIKIMKSMTSIELETFVHGALCVSYSGNCLMSSMIGKRSGNRGRCAQPCRMEYRLLIENEVMREAAYLLSPKDLMTLEDLDQLIDAGIDSFKIEGRMKSSEYVALVVSKYRKAIDSYYERRQLDIEDQDIYELYKVFNREFTRGYLFNEIDSNIVNSYRPNHMGVEIGKIVKSPSSKIAIELVDAVAQGDGLRILTDQEDFGILLNRIYLNGRLVNSAQEGDIIEVDFNKYPPFGSKVIKSSDVLLNKKLNKVLEIENIALPLFMHFSATKGSNATLTINDPDENYVQVHSLSLMEKALQTPTSLERVQEQLSKLGNTPFTLKNLKIVMDEDINIPISTLNQLRRDGIEALIGVKKNKAIRNEKPYLLQKVPFLAKVEPSILSAKVETEDQLIACMEQKIPRIIYQDIDTYDEMVKKYPAQTLICGCPRVYQKIKSIKPMEKISCNEWGYLYQNQENEKMSDVYMNVTNIETIKLLHDLNVQFVALSLELNKMQISEIVEHYYHQYNSYPSLEVVVYGRADLMISKYCPIQKGLQGNHKHCGLCSSKQFYLQDRMDYKFPIVGDSHCMVRILNSVKLSLLEEVEDLMTRKIHSLRLDFTIESKEETLAVIQAFQQKLNHEPSELGFRDTTFGHYHRLTTF